MRQNHHYNTTMTCAGVVGSKVKPLVGSLIGPYGSSKLV